MNLRPYEKQTNSTFRTVNTFKPHCLCKCAVH